MKERDEKSRNTISDASAESSTAARIPEPTRLLTATQVAARLTVSRRTLERLISAGDFPPPLKIGRSARFRPEDISTFLEKLRRDRGDKVGAS